jgi:alkanesulfonate monooxygenase SsuD/methylene tetrahydromethanopterin reductase-like flavin-dependent oxidoreductase (luciferase family)
MLDGPPADAERNILMHIGLGLTMQNLDDKITDLEVYRQELSLAARAEAVGFDSVWFSEHHFSDYQLTPQTPMVLSWLAGQSTRIKLGQMVTVLPWHDPVRVAESYVVLDHLSGGRAIMGIGRGLGRIEFDKFRLRMGESRRRFTEYIEAILGALETGYIEHHGDLYEQPRAAIRPRPFSSYKGRTYAAAVSPHSIELMARMGVGILVIAQKPWDAAEAELAQYRGRYLQFNGFEAPKPVLVLVAGVSKNRKQAQKMREVYLQRWALSTVEHYQFDNPGFAEIEGYEYYGALASHIAKHGLERFNRFLADLQVWGSPGEVTEKLIDYTKRCDAGALVVDLTFGGMPYDEAIANFELFTSEVLPELLRHDVGGDIGVSYASAPERAPAR